MGRKTTPLVFVAVGLMGAAALGISAGLAFLRGLYDEPDHPDANAERDEPPAKPTPTTRRSSMKKNEAYEAMESGVITREEYESLARRRGWKI